MLALLYLGTGDGSGTEKELKNLLGSYSKKKVKKWFLESSSLLKSSEYVTLSNYLLFPNEVDIVEDYIRYEIDIDTLDVTEPSKEAKRINKIVAKETDNMITSIISPKEIDGDTDMVALNTIYFKATWANKFDKKLTKEEPFTKRDKTESNVYMMKKEKRSEFYYTDEINQVLELLYVGSKFSMGFILPIKKSSAAPNLTQEMFQTYTGHLNREKLENIWIPKFTHEATYNLKPILKKLGIKTMWKDIDLSNMIIQQAEGDNIPRYITSFGQKAIIIVDEDGTKAAAATKVVKAKKCAVKGEKKLIDFIANHPFTYYIRYIPTNDVLFVGNFTS